MSKHRFRVYYEDTDSGGVVYYANYLKFLERARTEALFSIGYSNKKIKDNFGSLIIVKACNIEYKKSAHLEDELTVRSFVKSITKTSFFMNQIITKDDDVIIEAQVHLVFVNNDGKPVRIPDEIYLKFKLVFLIMIEIMKINVSYVIEMYQLNIKDYLTLLVFYSGTLIILTIYTIIQLETNLPLLIDLSIFKLHLQEVSRFLKSHDK